MSEVELVSYLKRLAVLSEPSTYTFKLVETIDTITRLLKERDEARAEGDRRFEKESEWVAANREWAAKCRAAEAQVAALSMQLDGARGCLKETEARVVKLQRALQSAIDMLEPVGHDYDTPEQSKIDWKNDLASLRKDLEATR